MRNGLIQSHRQRVSPATASLLAVVVAALGVIFGVLVAPEAVPQSISAPQGPRTVRVSAEEFDDAHDVAVQPVLAETTDLTLAETGRVTRSDCSEGMSLASGKTLLVVDDRPAIALATDIPLWRDLGVGTRGADVASLQSELVRLGYSVAIDGSYGMQTRAAVDALLAANGVVHPPGLISANSIVWLPSPEVVLSTCEIRVGDAFGGGTVAVLAGGVASLRIVGDTTVFVAGDRVLRYHALVAPVSAVGVVTDPAFLAEVAKGPELAYALAQGGPGNLTLAYALAEPLSVVVVPPAALYGLTTDGGCVIADGSPHKVRVISSALGQTLVAFADGSAPTTVDIAPNATAQADECL